METNHGSRIPDAKELPQPADLPLREVGRNHIATTDRALLLTTIARVCHEANRAWCVANGDDSQVPWDDAPEWQRQSAINGVQAALVGATPEQLHESWMQEKQRDGWVYGAVKNAATKEHPCLVPYDKLPIEQRRKDHLFRAIVSALTTPTAEV